MIDVSPVSPDETRHIESSEKYMSVLIERISDNNNDTDFRLEMIASCLNIMKEFMIAESKYVRFIQYDIDKAIRKQL